MVGSFSSRATTPRCRRRSSSSVRRTPLIVTPEETQNGPGVYAPHRRRLSRARGVGRTGDTPEQRLHERAKRVHQPAPLGRSFERIADAFRVCDDDGPATRPDSDKLRIEVEPYLVRTWQCGALQPDAETMEQPSVHAGGSSIAGIRSP